MLRVRVTEDPISSRHTDMSMVLRVHNCGGVVRLAITLFKIPNYPVNFLFS